MNRTRRGHTRRGFTLVELGAVVAIIGILSVLALVSYRKYILYSKITEAKSTISAIKIAQEDFKAEKGTYADIGSANWCPPAGGDGQHLTGWGGASCVNWQTLPVHVSGAVLFQYRTFTGNAAFADDGFSTGWVTGTANIPAPWYAVNAQCNLDADTSSPSTKLFSSSYGTQIFSVNDGQ